MASVMRGSREHVPMQQEDRVPCGESTEEDTDEMDESKGPLEESGGTISEEEDIDDAVLDDMERFEQSFKGITQRYRLINRIGEGTFSTVYKAEDLLYDHYENEWDFDGDKENINSSKHSVQRAQQQSRQQRAKFVAIKKIYVTSSPLRILNELELLHDLRSAPNICPLITAFRHQDQVIAILPFFSHKDFREYYRSFTVADMRVYFHSLFTALEAVHDCHIIHRDIKPTNFLYSPSERRGVLVDFGLAEKAQTTTTAHAVWIPGPPEEDPFFRLRQHDLSSTSSEPARTKTNVPNNDPRSSRRANRAGTRGFRAPEVLLKCTAQTVLIDVWSAGIMLLTFLSKRFPFFHSADDIDAFIELCCIFGRKRMRDTALLHGQVLQTNIPTISENGHGWEKILLWCTSRNKKRDESAEEGGLSSEELEAVEFMRVCLELDPARRITAAEALRHPFLAGVGGDVTMSSDELGG